VDLESANAFIRSAVDATNRRDLVVLDELWSEDTEFHSTFAASEGSVFRGHPGLREYFAALDEAFDDVQIEVEGIEPAGGDRFVVTVIVTGRGSASGVPVEHHYGQVWTIVAGTVTRIESYLDPADARNATE
jgi:ketosteroid isomerase-like protein